MIHNITFKGRSLIRPPAGSGSLFFVIGFPEICKNKINNGWVMGGHVI
jgi:hypothetical protein